MKIASSSSTVNLVKQLIDIKLYGVWCLGSSRNPGTLEDLWNGVIVYNNQETQEESLLVGIHDWDPKFKMVEPEVVKKNYM